MALSGSGVRDVFQQEREENRVVKVQRKKFIWENVGKVQKRREKFKESVKSSEENENGEAKMRKTTEKRDREERNWQREEIVMFFRNLAVMALTLIVMFGVVFGVYRVHDNAMSPRISAGDLLFYYRLEKQLRTQDVVVLRKDGKRYVGRVVAKSGDQVEVTEDACLKVNGNLIVETDIFYDTLRDGDHLNYPVILGDGQYFVLGDFRIGAEDSRYFGPVEKSEILGKVLILLRRTGF